MKFSGFQTSFLHPSSSCSFLFSEALGDNKYSKKAYGQMEKTVLSLKEVKRGIKARYCETYASPPPEVETPTYEIVGKVDRYDQRDHPNARAVLVPKSLEYEDYYRRHP